MKLQLLAERYSPSGSIAGMAATDLLGAPKVGVLLSFLRETVQNTWDAALPSSTGRAIVESREPVKYSLHSWVLDSRQRGVLRDCIPVSDGMGNLARKVAELMRQNHVRVLAVADRNTEGLGGPTRADIHVSENASEPTNYRDFVLNVGAPQDKVGGGGTYGFGKSAAFALSEVGVVLAHTHCTNGGLEESRFVGIGLGTSFDAHGNEYTGRYWWGKKCPEQRIEPVRGDAADELAYALGMPCFRPGQRGTTLLVVAPRLENPEASFNTFRTGLLWYFWPKMVQLASLSRPEMEFSLHLDGEDYLVPQFEDGHGVGPLDCFSSVLHELLKWKEHGTHKEGMTIREIRCGKPKRLLGHVALSLRSRRLDEERAPTTGDLFNIGRRSHHVALMRNVRLVVKYLDCEEYPSEFAEYCGVFLPADDEMDDIYSKSEPPSHDDWSRSRRLSRPEQTFVNVTQRRIMEEVAKWVAPADPPSGTSTQVRSVAGFARYLGHTIADHDPEPRPRDRETGKRAQSSATRAKRARVDVSKVDYLEEQRGSVRVSCRVLPPADGGLFEVSVGLGVMLEGGAKESEPPIGAKTGKLLKASVLPPGELLSAELEACRLLVRGKKEFDVHLVVQVPEDSGLLFDVKCKRMEAS